MVCLIALIIFSILGIFSLSYRKLAKEAFQCVFRRLTLRPCQTNLKQKIKSKLTAKFLKTNKSLGRLIFRYFEVLSWIFTLIFFISLFLTARTVYNLIKFGNCSPSSPTSCIFKPQATSCGGSQCETKCLCEKKGCEPPELKGCQGDCDCIKDVCITK